ncbi:TRAP transporter small permease subunit [Roseibium sp.]|uniref:TRAP transporter small permease subunit n=1 Tax=Roseibium sp. TaxID=1936156 RepID=UPI003A97D3FF
MLAVLAAFVLNNYLTYWQDLPGVAPIFGGAANGTESAVWSWGQLAIYAAFVLIAIAYVGRSGSTTLRDDSKRISDINAYLIRAVFFAVLIVGLVDAVISFLRVEELLPAVVGAELANDLGKSQLRGAYVHMPLIALSFVIAFFSRTLGFTWLALLVVAAELIIVIGRFVFSYEQAFLADLVRFWYAALFLFASAYTLVEEGHVRVDVFYAAFSRRTKGRVNMIGTLLLGMTLCWTILLIGMGGKQNIINSPILSYETTQAGFGLYVKYLMAGFLGVFAVSMLIQFVSYFLDAVADVRGEPGGRDHDVHTVQ